MTDLAPTPGQTVGPFFGYALPFDRDNELVPLSHPSAVRLHGRVTDGDGVGVPGRAARAVAGRTRRFRGAAGRFAAPRRLDVHRLGPRVHRRRRALRLHDACGPGRPRRAGAPFFAVTVFARGLLNRLFTRAYLPDDADALAGDAAAGLARCRPTRHAGLAAPTSTGTRSTSGSRATTRPCSCGTRANDRPLLAGRRARRHHDVGGVVPRGHGPRRGGLARRPRLRRASLRTRRRRTSPGWSDRPTSRRSPSRAEAGRQPGDPVGVVAAQRVRESNEDAATWLHRGLTSQDVVDTALMLCLRRGPGPGDAPSCVTRWPRSRGSPTSTGPR